MGFPQFIRRSPNHGSATHAKSGVVFHHSELDFEATIGLMLRPESEVSYHCLIAADGRRCTLVPDDQIAWHAGASRFQGRSRCNDFMLGVAFEGDTALAPLTPEQIGSAIEWISTRWLTFGWTHDWVTDHRQVAPGRKRDLDPAQWARLIAAIRASFPD
jgi:AmpD protein